VRVRLEFATLAAPVVGVEDEAVFVEALEEDYAGRRAAVGRRGGEGHGVGFVEVRGERLPEPPAKLFYGVRVAVGLFEPGSGVLFAEAGDVVQGLPAPGAWTALNLAGLYAATVHCASPRCRFREIIRAERPPSESTARQQVLRGTPLLKTKVYSSSRANRCGLRERRALTI
jgi:hypothetical protein